MSEITVVDLLAVHLKEIEAHGRDKCQADIHLLPWPMPFGVCMLEGENVLCVGGYWEAEDGRRVVWSATTLLASRYPHRVHGLYRNVCKHALIGHSEIWAYNDPDFDRANRHLRVLGFQRTRTMFVEGQEVWEFRMEAS